MLFFCTLFGSKPLSQATLLSLSTSRSLGILNVAMPTSTNNMVLLQKQLKLFKHLRADLFAVPATRFWNDEMDWLKLLFLQRYIGRGPVVYVDTDMLFSPDARELFAAVYRSNTSFDIAYTVREESSEFGAVNAGVTLFVANAASVAWAWSLLNHTDHDNGPLKQNYIDGRFQLGRNAPSLPLWMWPDYTNVIDELTGARLLKLPMKPLNLLEGACDEPGVLHYHGPYKKRAFECCNLSLTESSAHAYCRRRSKVQSQMTARKKKHAKKRRTRLSSLRGGYGYCGVTRDDNMGCREGQRSGSWRTSAWSPTFAEDCIKLCEGCSSCNFVSFSKKWNDCSYFSECSLKALHTKTVGFYTVEVRPQLPRVVTSM